jgi:hypothetical protein
MIRNATLSYGSKSIDIFVTRLSYSVSSQISSSQTRKGLVSYLRSAPNQNAISVSGASRSVDEYFELSEFIRAWQRAVAGSISGEMVPMSFSVRPSSNPTHRLNFTQYLVAPTRFSYVRRHTDVAPTYDIDFVVVSGKATKLTGLDSILIGDYVWEQSDSLPSEVGSFGDDAFQKGEGGKHTSW